MVIFLIGRYIGELTLTTNNAPFLHGRSQKNENSVTGKTYEKRVLMAFYIKQRNNVIRNDVT